MLSITGNAATEIFDSNMLKVCQEELKEYYLEEMGKVNLLPWIPGESKDMENIFVELKLVTKEEAKLSQDVTKNEDLVTLKTKQGQRVNRVLVTGDAGSGKSTTAANIAYKWATLKDSLGIKSPLSEFSLVFLLRMKDIENSNASLVDLIFQHILPEDSNVSKDGLRLYIKENAKDILFIIDGMDEDSSGALKNESSEITKLLHNRKLRKSCVILTSRPQNISDLGMHEKHYTQIKLEGFSDENIHDYIFKFFEGDEDKISMLVKKLQREQHIQAMASIPVLLLMICLLWEDQSTIPKTKTQLYQQTIKYIWKRYKAKTGGDLPLDADLDNKELDEELKDLLNKLGKVALNNMHLNGCKFTFTEKEFEKDVCNLGCQVGILTKEQSRSGLERKTVVQFLHSTFQRYCAAVYLAYLLKSNQAKLEDFYGKLFIFQEFQFIDDYQTMEFCCGLQPQVTATFFQYYFKHYSIQSAPKHATYLDISIHLPHIFEGQLSYEQCSDLIPLMESCPVAIELTNDLIPSTLYLLELYESTATHTCSGFLSAVKVLDIRTGCTPWLPTLLSYTTSLHQCRVTLNFPSETALDGMFKAISTLPNLKELILLNIGHLLFHRLDLTNLLKLLIKNRVKLTELYLTGFQFDAKVMASYLSSTSASISKLALSGPFEPDAHGGYQLTAIKDVVESLTSLKKLNSLRMSAFQISSAIKKLRPIVSQLEVLNLPSCRLQEKHLKELFSFLSRAQKLKFLNLSHNLFSVTSVEALLESLTKVPVLEKLILAGTGLNDASACILATFVKGKSSINCLCLDDNPDIGLMGKYALRGLPLKHRLPSLYETRYEDIDTL